MTSYVIHANVTPEQLASTKLKVTPLPVGPAGPAAQLASQAETFAGVSTTKAVTPAGVAAALPHLDARADGVVADGSDCTAAVNALLTRWYARGGGEIRWPEGTIRIDGQIVAPNDGQATPHQPPMRWVGAGAFFSGQSAAPLGGTILDLRYSGADAKIVTLGLGLLEITGITFTDLGTSSTPFILTTNTTLVADRCGFYGNAAKSGAACDQDAIVLGGTTNVLGGLTTSPFQGYGTVISRCYFNRIRRGIYGRTYCNGVVVRDNIWWQNCGATAAEAAIEFDGFALSSPDTGVYVAGNLIECTGYVQGVKCQQTVNSYFANNFFDPGVNLASYYLFGDDTLYNIVIDVYRADSKPLLIETGNAVNTNTVITGHQSQSSIAAQPWRFTNIGNGVEFAGVARFTGGSGNLIIQPATAQSDSVELLRMRRSAAESVNPSADIMIVKQTGRVMLSGDDPGVSFEDEAGVATGTVQPSTWSRAGAGGSMTIDSGTGGSNVDIKGFRLRFIDHTNARKIALGSALPADASINAGEMVIWFDPTNGASKLMVKAKSTNGTVVTGQLALA